MTINKEDLQEFFKQEEGQNFLNSMIEEKVAGLKNKKDELLGSLKKVKNEKEDLVKQFDDLKKQKEEAEIQRLTKEGDIDKITNELQKKFSSQLEQANAEKELVKRKLNSYVIDQNITATLAKNGVAGPLMEAAKALITTKYSVNIAEENDKLSVKIDGGDINEFISGWSQSDTGKYFVSAANNSGGSSNGASSGGKAEGGKSITRDAFESMSHAARTSFFRKGGQLVDN
jgi:hypothetical protein